MIRRPPRSTLDRSSAASDVYKRQVPDYQGVDDATVFWWDATATGVDEIRREGTGMYPVSYTHLRAHETVLDLVCRLLLEKKKIKQNNTSYTRTINKEHSTIDTR